MSRLFLLACCALLLSACSPKRSAEYLEDSPFPRYSCPEFFPSVPDDYQLPILWGNGLSDDDSPGIQASIDHMPVLRFDGPRDKPGELNSTLYTALETINVKTDCAFLYGAVGAVPMMVLAPYSGSDYILAITGSYGNYDWLGFDTETAQSLTRYTFQLIHSEEANAIEIFPGEAK